MHRNSFPPLTLSLSPSSMETHVYWKQNSSQRGVAMVLALISAVVLSPLYVDRKNEYYRHETRWSSGFVLPAVLVGLIVAIKTTSIQRGNRSESEASSVLLRIGNSSWGLAAILLMLLCVLSWQSSLQQLFWRWDKRKQRIVIIWNCDLQFCNYPNF